MRDEYDFSQGKTKLQRRLLKQNEILRAFVNKVANEKGECTHAYEAQQVMEQVRKIDKHIPEDAISSSDS